MSKGYSRTELEDVQARWRLRFPPDLVDLLHERRRLIGGKGSFDWIRSDPADIQGKLDWPFEGFWFDVEHNTAWWPEWGERPPRQSDRQERLKEVFRAAPKLIPLYAHRYLPEEPFEAGNPIFSVYQMDVIYYGADLSDWLIREEQGWLVSDRKDFKEIRFWSKTVERNGGEE